MSRNCSRKRSTPAEATFDLPLQAIGELVSMGSQVSCNLLFGASAPMRDEGIGETSQQ
jgi:hypothetical protein